MPYIGVIGAGSWGTALSVILARKGYDVALWAYERELAITMQRERMNHVYLPEVPLPDNLHVTHEMSECADNARFIVCAVPSQFVRSVFTEASPRFTSDAVVVSAAKGIEKGTLKTVSEVLGDVCVNRIAVLSGPSFAKEVVRGLPTAVTLASDNRKDSILLQEVLTTETFRVYTHHDVRGVELGGALKNVIAIASGISDGLSLGFNARAALITRGIAEIARLGARMGADAKTFSGLSGIGDLVLTCTGALSRNYTVGVKLGEGQQIGDIVASTRSIAEGVETSVSAEELSIRYNVDMPIVEQVYLVLHRGKSPREAVNDLMSRSPKDEFYEGQLSE